MTTLERLQKLITVELYHDARDIVPSAEFQTDLMMDCVDVEELAADCQTEFAVTISDDDLNAIVTVGDMVKLIDRLKGGR